MYGIIMSNAITAEKIREETKSRSFLSERVDVSEISESIAKSEMLGVKDFVILENNEEVTVEKILTKFSNGAIGIGKFTLKHSGKELRYTAIFKESSNKVFENILRGSLNISEFVRLLEEGMKRTMSGRGLKRIIEMFTRIGLYANLEGHGLLLEAVRKSLSHPERIKRVTTELYPEIAEAIGTSGKAVERNIRNAITVAYNRGKMIKVANMYYGGNFDENEKPTNSEFIAFLTTIASE